MAHDNESIAVFLPTGEPNPGLLAALLRHEYAHILVYETTRGKCPQWLNEAVAETSAKPMMRWERDQLDLAVSQKRCLPLSRLEEPFTELPPGEVSLAYRQCAALGALLFNRYGADGVRQLLLGLAADWTMDALFVQVFEAHVRDVEEELFGIAADSPTNAPRSR